MVRLYHESVVDFRRLKNLEDPENGRSWSPTGGGRLREGPMIVTLDRFRATFTANNRNDHVTMFVPHFPLVLSAKLSSFALTSETNFFVVFSSKYSFFQEKYKRESHVCRKRHSY